MILYSCTGWTLKNYPCRDELETSRLKLVFFDSVNFQSSVVTCTQDAKTGGKRICKERKPTPCTGTGNAFGDRNGANCGGQEAEKAGQVSSWRSLLVKQVECYSKYTRSGKVQTESLSGVATSQRGPWLLVIWQDRCVLGRRWMECTEQSCCCHNTSWKAIGSNLVAYPVSILK